MKYISNKYYSLILLAVIGVFNSIDRSVLALAMESIKEEFQLNDGQLGLMSGFAFALFYAVAGIPIARWADRGNRNLVITVTMGLWSVMMALSAFVGSFSQLLLVRVGVAVGESGCVPPAQSLIADYFDRSERPKAMAIYWLSIPSAVILSYLLGGWLIEQYGWRVAFLLLGIPGVILAFVARLTLQEPRLTSTAIQCSPQSHIQEKIPIEEVVFTLWRVISFRHLVMTFTVSLFFSVGIIAWIPSFFLRTYEMGAAELGLFLALGWGVGGLLFTYLGGYLATRFAANRESVQMKCAAFLMVMCSFFSFLCYYSVSKYAALTFVSIVLGGLIPLVTAPIYAAIQCLVERRMRAVALALIAMFANLIGTGFGPVAIGFLSDSLVPLFGDDSLRYALLIFSPGYLWCAYHAWKTSQTIEEDIQKIEESSIKEVEVPSTSSKPINDSLESSIVG